MFATSSEDLRDNPLADALRALREEDKSTIDLATMYKEDANALVKKAKSADSKSGTLHEAINTYSFALTFLDAAAKARKEGTEDPKDAAVDIDMMKSQINSNKAQVWLTLGNYRSCITDCDISLACWPGNAKSHYRKCKALQNLKRYTECISCCDAATTVLSNSSSGSSAVVPTSTLKATAGSNASELGTIAEIRAQCIEEQAKLLALEEKKRQQRRESEVKWGEIWNYKLKRNQQLESANKQAAKSTLSNGYRAQLTNAITLGYSSELPPIQLQEAYPEIDAETGYLCVPILFLYPQYSQLDAIHAAKSDSMIVEYLAEMFPEFEDGATPVEWDLRNEYQSSKMLVYCPVYQSKPALNLMEWIESCMERRQLQGLEGATATEEAKEAIMKRNKAFVTTLPTPPQLNSTPAAVDTIADLPGMKGFVEVHIGCSIEQILRLPGCVLNGGILTLLAFVKGNEAHRQFLTSSKTNGFQLMKLQPNEAISILK